jgi:hypothetical protein
VDSDFDAFLSSEDDVGFCYHILILHRANLETTEKLCKDGFLFHHCKVLSNTTEKSVSVSEMSEMS